MKREWPGQESSMDSLVKLLEASGIKNFDYGSNKELQKSLDKVEKKEDPFFNRPFISFHVLHRRLRPVSPARLVRLMTTRCMEEAVYFCTGQLDADQWQHFGLVSWLRKNVREDRDDIDIYNALNSCYVGQN